MPREKSSLSIMTYCLPYIEATLVFPPRSKNILPNLLSALLLVLCRRPFQNNFAMDQPVHDYIYLAVEV